LAPALVDDSPPPPLREIRIAATMPPAISAKTPKMIQRWSNPSFIGAKPRGTSGLDRVSASCDHRRVGSPDLIALAAATLHVTGTPERILEVGCGNGERTLFLAREYPSARVRGVDPSADAIRAATARIGLDPEGRVAFKLGERGALPFPDDHFDLVVGAGSAIACAETARVLRPGGELIGFAGERPRDRLGLRERRERRERGRLSRHGFEPLQSGGAGGGTYFVARLREGR
jgi:SAM-dependent methyltransferase